MSVRVNRRPLSPVQNESSSLKSYDHHNINHSATTLAEALRVRSWVQRLGLGALLPGNAAEVRHTLDDPLLNGVLFASLARVLEPRAPPLGTRAIHMRPATFEAARANFYAAFTIFKKVPGVVGIGGGGGDNDDAGTTATATITAYDIISSLPFSPTRRAMMSPTTTSTHHHHSHSKRTATAGSVSTSSQSEGGPQLSPNLISIDAIESLLTNGDKDAAWVILSSLAAAYAWRGIAGAGGGEGGGGGRGGVGGAFTLATARQGALMAWLRHSGVFNTLQVPATAVTLGVEAGTLDPILALVCDGSLLTALAAAGAGRPLTAPPPPPRTRGVASASLTKALAALRSLPKMTLKTLSESDDKLVSALLAGALITTVNVLEEVRGWWDRYIAIDGGAAWRLESDAKEWARCAPKATAITSLHSSNQTPERSSSAAVSSSSSSTLLLTPPKSPGRNLLSSTTTPVRANSGTNAKSPSRHYYPHSPHLTSTATATTTTTTTTTAAGGSGPVIPLIRSPGRGEIVSEPLITATTRVLLAAEAADAMTALAAIEAQAAAQRPPILPSTISAALIRLRITEGPELSAAVMNGWLRSHGVVLQHPEMLDPQMTDRIAYEWCDGRLLCTLVDAISGQGRGITPATTFTATATTTTTTQSQSQQPPTTTMVVVVPRTAASRLAAIKRALQILRRVPNLPLDLLWCEREICGGHPEVIRRLLFQLKKAFNGKKGAFAM